MQSNHKRINIYKIIKFVQKFVQMKCKLKLIFQIATLFLITFSINVFAFNEYKINKTFIKIDYKLNDSEILDFVDNFDLTKLNSIYFLNVDRCYNRELVNGLYYYNFKQIVIYRMSKNINIRGDSWRETFCHEYGHHIGWTKYRDLSERFAYYYCYDREHLGLGDKN